MVKRISRPDHTTGTIEFTTEDGIDYEIDYDCSSYVPATHWDPPEGGECEILEVRLDGKAVEVEFGEEDELALENQCRQDATDSEEGAYEAEMDARYEAMRDREFDN